MSTGFNVEYKIRQREFRRLNKLVTKSEYWKELKVARSQAVRQHSVKVQSGGSTPSAPAKQSIVPFRLPQKKG